jgi:hypothetical protein
MLHIDYEDAHAIFVSECFKNLKYVMMTKEAFALRSKIVPGITQLLA